MKASRLLAALGCLAALAAAGCSPALAPSTSAKATATRPAPLGTSPAKPPAPGPQQRAIADAAAISASFAVPPGARRVSGAPSAVGGVIRDPLPSSADTVNDTAWWLVPGQPVQVLRWERAHLSHRFLRSVITTDRPYSTGPDSAGPAWQDIYSLPPVTAVLDTRELWLMAAADGTGTTVIRLDAAVSWRPVRPAFEVIPSGVRSVTITGTPDMNLRVRPPAPVTIANQSKIRELAALIDALPLSPPGTFFCPIDVGTGITLVFRGQPAGPSLAVVSVNMSGCAGVSFALGDSGLPDLQQTPALVPRIFRIAGVHWDLGRRQQ